MPTEPTTDPTEEARALLWREQITRRLAYQASLWERLLAPPGPALAIRRAWQPILDKQAERDAGPTDPAEDP